MAGSAIPSSYTFAESNWWLFEGVSPGEFKMQIVIKDLVAQQEMLADEFDVSLKTVSQYYTMLNAEATLIANNTEFIALGGTEERYGTLDPLPGKSLSDIPDGSKALIFVHGMNVDLDAARKWFDETYKRLYWSGYTDNFIGIHWNGADPALIVGPPGKYNTNIHHAFQTGSLLATWIPPFAANHEVSIMTHSAGGPATLEALRLIQGTNPGAAKIKNLITTQAAAFDNIFSTKLGTVDGTPGSFDNLSWNNWFAPSLQMVSGKYENFYSADDFTLYFTLANANENVGVGKLAGHAVNFLARQILQVSSRDAWRLAFIIPGIHSFGPDEFFGVKCIIPHETETLGSHPAPLITNVNCEEVGFGIHNGERNFSAGSHSFMRETNYDAMALR
jgi:hypothetical protein